MIEQKIVADVDLPTGNNLTLPASFVKEGEERPGLAIGTLSLYIGDKKVGEGHIKTQPGTFGLGSARTVIRDFPGELPWRFTGGILRLVAVDVSGEPYVDVEWQAEAMLLRE